MQGQRPTLSSASSPAQTSRRETQARIADIAEGNPLFVEQLLAFLEEAGPEALESVPPSVEALLASRLDRLESEELDVLERAAVAGREFARSAVRT